MIYTQVMRVDYEEVVAAYERDLQTRLRGFKPAHPFLEGWVHDANPARSILNMVEAAELGDLPSLEIRIGPETAKVLDRAYVRTWTAKVGRATLEEIPDGLLLKVDYE